MPEIFRKIKRTKSYICRHNYTEYQENGLTKRSTLFVRLISTFKYDENSIL